MEPVAAPAVEAFSRLFELALGVFGRNAATAAFFAALLESLAGVGVLFPGGTIVVLSGFAARASGGVGLIEVTMAAALGMTLGTAIDYWLGRLVGRRLVPRRAPWRLACRWRHSLRAANAFMSRWGWWAIFAANLAGPGRSVIAFAAGASGWSFAAYLGAQALASVAWGALYCGLGFFAAGELQTAEQLVGGLGIAAVLLLAIAVWAPALVTRAAVVAARVVRSPAPIRPS